MTIPVACFEAGERQFDYLVFREVVFLLDVVVSQMNSSA